MKRIISTLLVILTLCGILAVFALAESTEGFDILTSSKYAKTYTLSTSGKTVPYTSKSLSARGTVTYGASSSSYIANSSDELYLMDVGCTNGKYWAYVSYPTSSRRVNAYIPLSAITSNNAGHNKTTSTGKFYCSLREGSSNSSSYYVAKGDTVYLVATSGARYQILYPISGGKWRLAWCNSSDYDKYCGTPKTNNRDNTSDLVDVTAYFAGKTVTLKSVENGKYMCADGDRSNTPVMCNRSAASTWETFKVTSLTSDGWVGFKSSTNNKYLTAMSNVTDTPLRAYASKLQSWECFRIYQKGNDFYIKAQVNGKFLCVRVDKSGAPVQAYANAASTWERFRISFVGEEQYVSAAELVSTASSHGILATSNAYKALLSINSKYAPGLTSSQEKGTAVYLFEGVGSDSSSSKRLNAMCVVVKNGDIVYLNRNCSTIPDYPFNPAKNEKTSMPTLKSGVYSFTTVNHKGKYAALNVSGAQVVRFDSKSYYYDSTSVGINVHRRDTDSIAPSNKSWVNSAGCLLIGKSGTGSSSEYASFIKAVGIVKSNATAESKYSTSVKGTIVVDRAYASGYLSKVGYSSGAIRSIG